MVGEREGRRGEETTADDRRGRRLSRWLGLAEIVAGRLANRARTAPGRTLATVTLVAVTVALLLTVTGIAVALADDSTAGGGPDVRVTPENGATLSPVVDVEGPRLGEAHERSATIDAHDDVAYATPVLAEVVQVRTPESDEPELVLALGTVPREGGVTVGGVSTDALEPGDPHYAEGAYDGPQTGDVVLSESAADRLEAADGDRLLVRSTRTGSISQSHAVTAVDESSEASPSGELPIVVLRLSELQSLTGAEEGDLADQIVVERAPGADSDAVRSTIEDVYPDATIQSSGEVDESALYDDDVALATSAIAGLVGLVLCSLFVATAAAITVERDRRTIAVLEAVGFSGRSRLAIVALTTLVLALTGALVGIVLGAASIAAVNAVATATIAPGEIAVFTPAFVPYAIGVVLAAGLASLPYPLAIAARTNVLEELGR